MNLLRRPRGHQWLWLIIAALASACPGRAADVPAPRLPEALEMLGTLLHGSKMGPGEGWFHPSQNHYGWKWLAEHYDADHDGKVTRAELSAPADFFDRLDRDHDKVLTADDFDWSEQSAYSRQGRMARQWFSRIDHNSNGRISKEEWGEFYARIAKEKGYVTPDDLREAFPLKPPERSQKAAEKKEGPSAWTLLKGLASGELGSFHEGPGLGEPAPDFTLKTQNGSRTIRLSELRGKKPIVLIFGSFT
jgi:hypothetical protein